MQQIFITLALDLTDNAPSGAGWYVRAWADSKPLFDNVPVSPAAAYEASRGIQEALQSTEGELPQIALPQLVESGTTMIRGALEKQLAEAEAKAQQIAALRKALAKLPHA